MSKKFYITTSIPYVNSAPHLGNVLDSIYADVLARYKRQHSFDVRFLTGSDEHGVKIIRSAEASGLTPQEFVDKNSAKFRALKEILNLSWDDFIRTSDQKRHWPGAQKVWQKLADNGDLYKKTYRGLYCVGHEAFVTEKDLENGICKDHQKKPEIIEEENWFFKLSKYSKEIESKIKKNELKISPESRKNEILALLKEGLEDVSFSRPSKDLSWGVPVPNDSTQTMYVWAEALCNYISALGYGSEDGTLFKKYWPADVQVIGKDNLRFHAAIWPGMLLAAGLELPKEVFVHGFLTVDGQKISKTVGNVIDPVELVKKYGSAHSTGSGQAGSPQAGTDAVRYYLLREIPPFEDGDFSYEKFETLYNADLANGIGNFSARVLALAEKLGELKVDFKREANKDIISKIEEAKSSIEKNLETFRFNDAVFAIRSLVSFGDAYVNEKKPWQDNNKEVIVNLLVILDNVAMLLKPFLPETSDKITASLNWENGVLKIKKHEALFPRVNIS